MIFTQCINILWERPLYPEMVVSCEHNNKTSGQNALHRYFLERTQR